ncbi:hypothetical protein BGZ94_002925, partial [Podila epigama]
THDCFCGPYSTPASIKVIIARAIAAAPDYPQVAVGVELGEFKDLNQMTTWSNGQIDDTIADITLSGEFTAALDDNEYNVAVEEVLELDKDDSDIVSTMEKILLTTVTTFMELNKVVRRLDQRF